MPTRIIAGDCIVRARGRRASTRRGRVVVLVKPDDTVLVHDADGYQPVAWLTRPAQVTFDTDPLWLVAVDGDESVQVEAEGDVTVAEHDTSDAGVPVGTCPCGGPLVRAAGAVTCLGCDERYSLPGGASVIDDACDDCGLPRINVERGDTFDICLDYRCESLFAAVEDRFDGEWTCPECDGDLQILERGAIIAGCEHYPDCETGFGIPDGTIVEECGCGLPRFETANGERCLDTGCEMV